mmetsp:Transcript_117731/g.204985  ORF Transcript_117731/g.204985 Transcript_117731/m.204985 type:complete len:256 (-) Transcript_117731:1916-2683(-)
MAGSLQREVAILMTTLVGEGTMSSNCGWRSAHWYCPLPCHSEFSVFLVQKGSSLTWKSVRAHQKLISHRLATPSGCRQQTTLYVPGPRAAVRVTLSEIRYLLRTTIVSSSMDPAVRPPSCSARHTKMMMEYSRLLSTFIVMEVRALKRSSSSALAAVWFFGGGTVSWNWGLSSPCWYSPLASHRVEMQCSFQYGSMGCCTMLKGQVQNTRMMYGESFPGTYADGTSQYRPFVVWNSITMASDIMYAVLATTLSSS